MSVITQRIDLNSDVGENVSALADGSEERLLGVVSSANIACGGHAGDNATMKRVAELCLNHGVSIGAHPAYPDREHFGRKRMDLGEDELRGTISDQVGHLMRVAEAAGASVGHVKPHGALYNAAALDPKLAALIADAVADVDQRLVLVGMAGSVMLDVWRSAGFVVIAEAFADRRYESDGSLQSRSLAGSLITDPQEASRQALEIVCNRRVATAGGVHIAIDAQTLCIHSDTAGAAGIAAEIRRQLRAAGIDVRPF